MPTTARIKPCAICGVLITKRPKEDLTQWANRTTCSIVCKGKEITLKAEAAIPLFKACTTCGRVLAIDDFEPRSTLRYSSCKECRRVQSRVRYRLHGLTKKSHQPSTDPYKRQARSKLQRAVRDGKIISQPCEVCGSKAQAHHDDYSKPLDVRWLCPAHHGMQHWTPVSTPILAEAQRVIEIAIREGKPPE